MIGLYDRGCIYCGKGGVYSGSGHVLWVKINGELFYHCPNCKRLTPYDKENV
jgi:ribosomal protein L24E